jgi:DNA excision repair protein ERCC-4
LKIVIDSREPSWVQSQISAYPLLGIGEISTLPCGDVWIAQEDDLVIIERKEPNDLLASIADGRLFNQCAEMRQESDWCYVVITGQLMWGYDGKILGTQWGFRSVQGALLQAQELGVGIVYSQNDTDFAHTCYWLLSRSRKIHTHIPARKTGIPMADDQKILASLPGIGYERALELLKERNLRDAFLCLINADCNVSGIGPKTYKNIRQLFNMLDNERMEIKND